MKIMLCAFILAAGFCQAQVGIRVLATSGMASSYLSVKTNQEHFKPRYLPHAGLSLLIDVKDGVALKTGIGYQQKGWHARTTYIDDIEEVREEYTSRFTLHELSIPFLLCYTRNVSKAFQYSVGGGMNYGFLVSGREDFIYERYKHSQHVYTETHAWPAVIALISDESRLKNAIGGERFYLFNPALRMEAGLVWRQRYSIQAFWEHGLNSIDASYGSKEAFSLGYSGVAIGFFLKK